MGLQTIYDQTAEIERLIENYDPDQRDKLIEKLTNLLTTRGKLIERLSGKCSDEDRVIGEQIILTNHKINEALQSIILDVVKDMKQFRRRKQSVNRYRNPYQGPTKDGMFLDKRE